MSRMKRGFKLDEVDHYHSVIPQPVPFGMRAKTLATVTVSIGVFQAAESIDLPPDMVGSNAPAKEFLESDLYPTLLADALDTLNADVEIFLNDLGERGMI